MSARSPKSSIKLSIVIVSLLVVFLFATSIGCEDTLTQNVTVFYISNGGTAVPSESLPVGSWIPQPADPTRSGYLFSGWYIDQELTYGWEFESDSISHDMALFAKWDLISDPPEISDSFVTSRGFFIKAFADESYTIQANDNSGAGWVTISTSYEATSNEGTIHEIIWSQNTQFPIPTDLDVRLSTATDTSTSISITAQLIDLGTPNTSTTEESMYLDINGSSTGWAEGWAKAYLYASQYYWLQTNYYPAIDRMNGTYISVMDGEGNVVVYNSNEVVDDDGNSSLSGDFSEVASFRVPTNGTYYILVKSDQLTASPEAYDLTDYGYVFIDIAALIT